MAAAEKTMGAVFHSPSGRPLRPGDDGGRMTMRALSLPNKNRALFNVWSNRQSDIHWPAVHWSDIHWSDTYWSDAHWSDTRCVEIDGKWFSVIVVRPCLLGQRCYEVSLAPWVIFVLYDPRLRDVLSWVLLSIECCEVITAMGLFSEADAVIWFVIIVLSDFIVYVEMVIVITGRHFSFIRVSQWPHHKIYPLVSEFSVLCSHEWMNFRKRLDWKSWARRKINEYCFLSVVNSEITLLTFLSSSSTVSAWNSAAACWIISCG